MFVGTTVFEDGLATTLGCTTSAELPVVKWRT
jgi:hypothetical protein